MSSPPRFRCATPILALAVWLGGAAIIWSSLPTAPRLEFPFIPGTLAFTPDGSGVVVSRSQPADRAQPDAPTIAIELRAVPSGELIDTLALVREIGSIPGRSSDGRCLVFRDADSLDSQTKKPMANLVRLDLVERKTQRLSWPCPLDEIGRSIVVSPNGRFCFVSDDRVSINKPWLCDFLLERARPLPSASSNLAAFSANSRYLAARSSQRDTNIVVINTEDVDDDVQLRDPSLQGSVDRFFDLEFSDDNIHVAARHFAWNGVHQVICWDRITLASTINVSGYLIGFSDGGRLLLVLRSIGRQHFVDALDVASGELRWTLPINNHYGDVSPDGRYFLATDVGNSMSALNYWAQRIGISWLPDSEIDQLHCQVFDLETRMLVGTFTAENFSRFARMQFYHGNLSAFTPIPNGSIAIVSGEEKPIWQIWDVRPQCSRRAFAIKLAVFSAGLALFFWVWRRLAHRRVGRLS